MSIAQANLGTPQSGGGRFVDPNLVLPGWCVSIPHTVTSPSNVPVTGGSSTSGRIAELATLGLGVLGTGAVAQRLRSMRRLSESGRIIGSRPGALEPSIAYASAAIDPFGNSLLVDWIEAALRIAGRWHETDGSVAPDVRLVRAGPSGVEMLLASPAPVCPDPMTTVDGGRWWVLEAQSLGNPATLAPASGRLVPWLIPVGGDGDAVVLVAVGPGRHLAVDGDPTARAAALRGIVAALRALPWASELDTELVGIDPPPPTERCYHLFGSTLATLRALVARTPAPERLRVHPTWRREPLVVLSGTAAASPDDALTASLLEVSGVISDRGSGTETLVIDPRGPARLLPYGVELTVPQPSEQQSALLDVLFASAAESIPLSPPVERPEAWTPTEATSSWPGLVDVALFGVRPAVRGLAHPPAERDLDRLVELLAFLALHARRCTVGALGRTLYSRESPATVEQRVRNLCALARSVLPRPDGVPLLTVSGEEVTLDSSVTLDWERISSAIARARSIDPAAAIAALCAAFDEVDGAVILDDVSTYGWFRSEGFSSSIRGDLLDGAHHLATLAFAADDLDLAGRAVAWGLGIDPISEILVRDAMVLNDRAGEPDLAIETYRGLERALEILADAEPSSETRALFDALNDPTR
jgi:DNA-binding SARP family transcriptional activator